MWVLTTWTFTNSSQKNSNTIWSTDDLLVIQHNYGATSPCVVGNYPLYMGPVVQVAMWKFHSFPKSQSNGATQSSSTFHGMFHWKTIHPFLLGYLLGYPHFPNGKPPFFGMRIVGKTTRSMAEIGFYMNQGWTGTNGAWDWHSVPEIFLATFVYIYKPDSAGDFELVAGNICRKAPFFGAHFSSGKVEEMVKHYLTGGVSIGM